AGQCVHLPVFLWQRHRRLQDSSRSVPGKSPTHCELISRPRTPDSCLLRASPPRSSPVPPGYCRVACDFPRPAHVRRREVCCPGDRRLPTWTALKRPLSTVSELPPGREDESAHYLPSDGYQERSEARLHLHHAPKRRNKLCQTSSFVPTNRLPHEQGLSCRYRSRHE